MTSAISLFRSLRVIGFAIAIFLGVSFLIAPAPAGATTCAVPNSISNGQVADATAVMGNFNALKDCVNSAITPTGTPTSGKIAVFSGPTSITNGDLSGDCVTSNSTTTTCTKTNGAPFGPMATTSDASHLTGTVSVQRFNNGTNADSTHFLRGDGVWAVPSGGSGASGNWWTPFTPRAADFPTAFTGAGSNAALFDDPDIGLTLKLNNAGTSTFTTRGWAKALPTSGAWSVKARLTANIYNTDYSGGGLYIFESGTTNFGSESLMFDGTLYADSLNGTLTSFSSRGNRFQNSNSVWARIDYDGSSNYTFFMSNDGKNWLTTRVATRASMFTTAASHIGLGITTNVSLTDAANQTIVCDYWSQSW